MFFQINVTPKEKKVRRSPENEQEESKLEEQCTLVLAPFQPQARVKLVATVYNSVQCRLNVKNPSNRSLHVTVTKTPPKERSIELSAMELQVESESSADVLIVWTPQECGSWRDTLQLTDSRRVKYDVALISTALNGKKPGAKGKSRVLGPSNSNKTAAKPRNVSPPAPREAKKSASSATLGSSNLPNKRPRLNAQPDNKENVTKSGWVYELSSDKSTNSARGPLAHDFSAIMDSTNFNLTPVKCNIRSDPAIPKIEVTESNLIQFSPQATGIVSPEDANPPGLRRETYTAAKYRKVLTIHHEEVVEDEEKFADSLSPQVDGEQRACADQPDCKPGAQPSDFSVLINNMNFLTPKSPGNEVGALSFSPNECSTGNRTRSTVGNLSSNDASSLVFAGNGTFNVTASIGANNSAANETYELSTSPTRPADSIRPTRLSRSFAALSPVEKSEPPSRSPFYERLSILSEYETTTRTSIYHSSRLSLYDDASVKDVLEADLWAKPEVHQNAFSLSSLKGRCSSLEKIVEERSIGVRASALPAMREERPVKNRRLEISPPKRFSALGRSAPIRRISPTKSSKVRKEKSAQEPVASLRKKVQLNCSIKRGQVSIPGVRIANLSLAGLRRGARERSSSATGDSSKEVSVKLHDPNDFVTRYCNPDPFAATTTQDPFLSSTLYYDDKWMHHQEMEFKKWLNKLLTPPEHLTADVDTIRVDVGKVWQSCRLREDVALAETREAVSARYHTNHRLNTLRKAACAMFRREEVASALSRATVCIERGTLMIRQDRDLHRDIGLQKEILELFLSYNPLWLRIGLETVYGETIPLHSNNDLVGLTRFLLTRFFSDPFIVKTHSLSSVSSLKTPTFVHQMNKFILKKFALIVYFLDYAKRNKLIGHDPCLFHKRATHKESREILLTFSREVLSGIGDVTKVLRAHGYVVSHRQTYLDEYDYAVSDLSTDLRDGVRLCRVMELITGDRDLTSRCRVPAISRLQKVHNAEVALSALLRCGYTLAGDIDARSVADGHREKTLSLLWQIIYKYEAPRYEKAARTVQRWWRAKLWYVRVRRFLCARRANAAARIQRAWRCYRARKELRELREERKRLRARREAAARVIQLRWLRRLRMLEERRRFAVMREAIVRIQRWTRRTRASAPFVGEFRRKRSAAVTIQRRWRALILARRERWRYLELASACAKIQSWWRARQVTLRVYRRYRATREAAALVQAKWRALLAMRAARGSYQRTLRSARIVQSWWRRTLTLKRDRNAYLLKKHAVLTIESWWIGRRLVEVERSKLREARASAVTIQRAWRRFSRTKSERTNLKLHVNACRTLQQWWRAARVAKRYRLERKSCVIVQRWWRGVLRTKSHAATYASIRNAAILLQKNWRMKKARGDYLRMREVVAKLQTRYRNARVSRAVRREYAETKRASLLVQRWWRSLKVTRELRSEYLRYRETVVVVQTRWRATKLAARTRAGYLAKREAATRIQAYWRMVREKRSYSELLERHRAATVLQKRWRETLSAREARNSYLRYRSACVAIQSRYRAKRIGLQTRERYLEVCSAVWKVQRRWRANLKTREIRSRFIAYRRSAIVLQSTWRMIVERRRYRATRSAALTIQSAWRAHAQAGRVRSAYATLKTSVVFVQRRFRANRACRRAREEYESVRRRVIWIQTTWRKKLQNRTYEEAAIGIQTWWLAILEMRRCKKRYEGQRAAVLVIQRRYRAYKVGAQVRQEYARAVGSIVRIQRCWRSVIVRRRYKEWLRDCKVSALIIEKWWIEKLRIKSVREAELALQRQRTVAATRIQTAWRGWKVRSSQSAIMKELRERLKVAAQTAVPTATVAFQMQESMDTFLGCDTIGQLSMCLTSLDTLTRLSAAGCINFCERHLVDKTYATLNKSNRSLPWMDVCLRCTSILITLAKLPATKNYVYRVEYIETLARLMTITVEHHVNVFLHLATLLWLLAENPQYAEAITSCPRSTWLLTSLHSTITKKKSKLPVGNLNKSRFREQVAPLPNSKPDWGLRQKRPRLFTTVHHAIASLIKRLKIDTT